MCEKDKTLKKLMSVILFALVFTVQAQNIPRFEFGVILGEPLGFSAKLWYTQRTAADVAAAWSFTENGIFEVHADYLVSPFLLKDGTLPLYIGLGPTLRIGNDWFLGARLPIGAQYLFQKLPLSIFGEVAPQWQLIPDNKFVLSGGLGIRLTFGSVS